MAATAGLYLFYARARDANGASSAHGYPRALRHARQVVRAEHVLNLPSERAMQRLILPHHGLLRLLGGYYGSAHFLVTAGVLIWLVTRRPSAAARWAGVLAVTTACAVSVFWAYPVAPPRLMPPGPDLTVDTLSAIGGLWNYNHGVLERINDPFAAMPSLHLAWALWCSLALWHTRRARVAAGWSRLSLVAFVLGYPLLTGFTVLATGTHWTLDLVAGLALVAAVAAAAAGLAPFSARYGGRNRASAVAPGASKSLR